MSNQITFIGEAPGDKTTVEHSPLHYLGRNQSGNRLRLLTGLSDEEYLSQTARYNLVPYPLRGERWPTELARSNALSLCNGGLLRNRNVVLLGQKVAAAFDIEAPYFQWVSTEWDFNVALCPHPSGFNRIWNENSNRQRAINFFRKEFDDDWSSYHRTYSSSCNG